MKKTIQKVFLSAILICVLAMPAMADSDTSPVIDLVTLDSTEPNTDADILVTVSVTDDVEVTSVTANDEPLSISGIGTWEGTITAIDGTNTVNVSASDADGNITYDETASYTTISDGTAGGEGVVAEEPTEIVDEPIADEPIIDEPIIDEPIIDEPIADEPIIDEPIADEPNGIPGFGLLTGLSVMLIATQFLRKDK